MAIPASISKNHLTIHFTHKWEDPIWEECALTIADIAKLLQNTDLEADRHPENWQKIHVAEIPCANEEMQAIGCVFTNDRQGIIAFAQELPFETFFKSGLDLAQTLPSSAAIDDFVQNARGLEAMQEKRHFIVGHGLGGSLAHLAGYAQQLPSLSLDGIGVKDLIDNLEEARATAAKTIMLMPHLLNQSREAIGTTHFSYPVPRERLVSVNSKRDFERYLALFAKAQQNEFDSRKDRESFCEMSRFMGKCSPLSVFLEGKMNHDRGEAMRLLAEQCYQNNRVVKANLAKGLAVHSTGQLMQSLSGVVGGTSHIIQGAGEGVANGGLAMRESRMAQARGGFSANSMSLSANAAGCVVQGVGNGIGFVGRSGELAGESAEQAGPLIAQLGMNMAWDALQDREHEAYLLTRFNDISGRIEAQLTH